LIAAHACAKEARVSCAPTFPGIDVGTPTLETARLRLRPWRESDLDAFAAMMAEPEVARFLTADQAPQDRATAWRGMALMVGHWALRGYGMFVVEEKASGAFVGRVGAWQPECWVGFELGWGLHPDFQGRGYAFEAARAAGAWAFEKFDLPELVSVVRYDNTRSQNLATKLGMKPDRQTIHVGMRHDVWLISRADWAEKNQLHSVS
jgi:RimJ/RimL family protein N-acetyltransferase